MGIDNRELAAEYSQYSDEELAALAAEMDKLTDTARGALQGEIQRRGISSAQLEKLHGRELHREARFDQKERVRRKQTLVYLLTRGDPKGWIWVAIGALVFIVFEWLRSKMR
jgi:hypothetical protein